MKGVVEVLRPVDLARESGLSTQAIRNYADAGILPATDRSPSGYRRFDRIHLDALLTYRALSTGFGPVTARAIMQSVNAKDLPAALATIDSAHAAIHQQRLSLRAAAEALEAVAAHEPDDGDLPRSGLRIGDVAGRLGVRSSALRVWEAAGLLTPERERGTRYRTYGPADVRDARMVDLLRRSHYGFDQIRTVLDGLRRSGSSDALQAVLTQRRTTLDHLSAAMINGTARLDAYTSAVSVSFTET